MSESRAIRELLYSLQMTPKSQFESGSSILASADMQIRVDILASAEVSKSEKSK